MSINLHSLEQLLNKYPKISSQFDIDITKNKLIAELSFDDDLFFIYTISKKFRFLICCFYYDNISYRYRSTFIFCQGESDIIVSLRDEIKTVYDIENIQCEKRWWSYLPSWMVLEPRYINKSCSNLFLKEIRRSLSGIDVKDLSPKELDLSNKWYSVLS